MPNLAATLKAEITRLARKELNSQTDDLKKTVAHHRSEIAALKRRAIVLERQVKRLAKQLPQKATPTSADSVSPSSRFNAKGFASHRAKLGISAGDCGALVGASGQSVYKWEAGKAKPQARHMPAIAAFRKMGKRAALATLAKLKG